MERLGMWVIFDIDIASTLGITRGEYITKIESTTPYRQTVIIGGLLSEDKKVVSKAIRVFNLII